jgi:hypothetical protein
MTKKTRKHGYAPAKVRKVTEEDRNKVGKDTRDFYKDDMAGYGIKIEDSRKLLPPVTK